MLASVILWALSIGVFLFLRYATPESLSAYDSWSLAQSCAAPIMLAALASLRIGGRRIPGACIGLMAALLVLGLINLLRPSGSFAAARLDEDPYEVVGRGLRERVQPISRVPRTFANSLQAQEYLEREPTLRALVWGSERWLRVSFSARLRSDLYLDSALHSLREDTGLMMVSELPEIGLAPASDSATARYLAALLEAFKAAQRSALLSTPSSEQELGYLTNLSAAAYVSGGWTSYDHRALPLWLLGNHYLLAAAQSSSAAAQQALLTCAGRYYALARRYLRPNKRSFGYRELLAATVNNEALVSALYYRLSGDTRVLQRMRKQVKAAKRMLDTKTLHGGINRPALVAQENFRRIRESKLAKRRLRAEGKSLGRSKGKIKSASKRHAQAGDPTRQPGDPTKKRARSVDLLD
jgi:hypothetical protein